MLVLRYLLVVVLAIGIVRLLQHWLMENASGWLTRYDITRPQPHHHHLPPDDTEPYFRDPGVRTQRCDVCRIIASRFDTGFELAETNLLNGRSELEEDEVNNIVDNVCMKWSFQEV